MKQSSCSPTGLGVLQQERDLLEYLGRRVWADVSKVVDRLTASTFIKVPGLLIPHSRDLVNWTINRYAVTSGHDDVPPVGALAAPPRRYVIRTAGPGRCSNA
ncbi:hypothetical protein ACIBQ1_24960 [Nonomuraea sp. NPDC050153]|uniref:hypothetical protein n=1 Tax=Nonomuraea sp. NPDC050153 TaxID=3364359 RepID=UPI00378A06FD